jgi:hypothetical protein
MGGLNYTVYGGRIPSDMQGGFVYGITTQAMANTPQGRQLVPAVGTSGAKKVDSYSGPVYGADLRWNTPLKGLLAGASIADFGINLTGSIPASNNHPYFNNTLTDRVYAFYTQYSIGNLSLTGEYRKENRNNNYNNASDVVGITLRNSRQGYVSAAYRFSKWLELGTYHSRFILNWDQNHGDPRNHIFDQAVTARLDLNRFMDVKVEGHFMDGAMVTNGLNRGFYLASNPIGLKPQMAMMVVRLGFHL